MRSISFENIILKGDLGARAALLGARLEGKEYRPESIFSMDSAGWPADWEGRTILAITLISQLTRKEPVYLDEIIDELEQQLNEKGYLKDILPENEFNEQQLSGHSWLLRGLVELYKWRKEDRVLKIIKSIVENLFLPTKGFYDKYPTEPRSHEGEHAGQVFDKSQNWYLSSDTGCVYIPLDGLSHAYEVLKDESLLELIEEMIENFLKLDLIKIQAQTHASLSASRGIMKMYSLTKKDSYLEAAKKIFDLYLLEGMTANFANYNWFGRPQWTEPCAIIDSYILAIELFKGTKNPEYLDWAQKIWYNALEAAQRPNGGFGCDQCAGATTDYIEISTYEAYWCCTMRGGEGLAKGARFTYLVDNNNIYITNPNSSIAKLQLASGEITLKLATKYPEEGYLKLELLESNTTDFTIYLYMPAWAKGALVNGKQAQIVDGFLELSFNEASSLEVCFEIPTYTMVPYGNNNTKDKKLTMKGSLILGGEEQRPIKDAVYKQVYEIFEKKEKILN